MPLVQVVSVGLLMGRTFGDVAIGRRLEEIRLARRLTQKRMAGKLGLTPRMLRYYVQGRVAPTVDRLRQLALLLDCTLLDLFEPPGSPVPRPRAQLNSIDGGRPDENAGEVGMNDDD